MAAELRVVVLSLIRIAEFLVVVLIVKKWLLYRFCVLLSVMSGRCLSYRVAVFTCSSRSRDIFDPVFLIYVAAVCCVCRVHYSCCG